MNVSQAIKREIWETARELWQFVKSPHLNFSDEPGRLWVASFITIVLIDIVLMDNLLNLPLYLIEKYGYEPPNEIQANLHDGREWMLLLLAAPLMEEPAFRGWLNGKKRNLFALAAFTPVLLFTYTTIPTWNNGQMLLLLTISVVCIPIWWASQSNKPQPVPLWFLQNFRWIVYASAAAFGLIHIVNFTNFEWGPDVLYVVPQAIGGLIMTFTRLRLGLSAAMLHHALYNAYFITTELLQTM